MPRTAREERSGLLLSHVSLVNDILVRVVMSIAPNMVPTSSIPHCRNLLRGDSSRLLALSTAGAQGRDWVCGGGYINQSIGMK